MRPAGLRTGAAAFGVLIGTFDSFGVFIVSSHSGVKMPPKPHHSLGLDFCDYARPFAGVDRNFELLEKALQMLEPVMEATALQLSRSFHQITPRRC